MADAGSEWLVAGTPWFRIDGCPLAHECSRQAFNRSKVRGWTEEEAKERLHHRLLHSSCHKDSFTDHFTPEDAVAGAVVVDEFVTEQEVARQAKQHDWKSGGDGKRQRTGDRQVRSPMRELGASAKAAGALAQAPDTPPPMHLLRGSSSSGLLAVGPVDNRQVSVRVIELQAVVDAARRASSAAKQAKRICESAARAFSSEAEVLDACVENFERVIPSTFSSGL